jgi:predicted neuraminidase
MMMKSEDSGQSWSRPVRLPDDIAGPIKNKPVELGKGRFLCGSSTENHGWQVHLEWTDDLGKTWSRTGDLNDGKTGQAIQPTILLHGGDKLQILCRPKGTGKIMTSWSADNGQSWSKLEDTSLPNPNSGLDAVTLKDGRHLLVYNHTSKGRSPLNVAVSADGKAWQAAAVLENEPGEYSYPAVIQTSDGQVHITYTWQRKRVRHVVLDPAKLVLTQIQAAR